MPSGKSFNILKPKVFVADILPEHFKDAKYSSFTRKLHRWGFMRHYRGEEAGAFYHPSFQKGRLDLVEQMSCHKTEPPKCSGAISAVAAERAIAKPAAPKPVVKPAVKPALAAPKPIPAPLRAQPQLPVLPPVVATPATPQRTPIRLPTFVNNSSLPPMAPRLSTPSTTVRVTGAGSNLDSERLNAAIEMEVNRRIKERLNAVALSRRAFAVSALRQQQLTSSFELQQQQHRQQQQQQHHRHLTLEANAASQVAAALLLQKQAGIIKNSSGGVVPGALGPSSSMGYRALSGEGRPMPGAPPTNIQGARTA